jgi:hypothetical protein
VGGEMRQMRRRRRSRWNAGKRHVR